MSQAINWWEKRRLQPNCNVWEVHVGSRALASIVSGPTDVPQDASEPY